MQGKESAKKLHLGCGEKYLDGYWNVDFPPSEHTLQRTSPADEHADILRMNYPEGIEEIRMHHVFEHFTKPEACALLTKWQTALKERGVLHIEVPDVGRSAWMLLDPFASVKRKCVVERHLFGSHEAPWAVHHAGYTRALLQHLLATFGFRIIRTTRTAWKDTRNLIVIAEKERHVDRVACVAATEDYLRTFLVDDSSSEGRLLAIWMDAYKKACNGS